MSDNLYYLLTLLPSLPNLGEPLAPEDAIAKIREESDEKLLLLADLLECESEIENCASHYYVQGSRDFVVNLSERLPEKFCEVFATYTSRDEADWLTAIYAAWLNFCSKSVIPLVPICLKNGSDGNIRCAPDCASNA